MESLRKQVARARRRLILSTLVNATAWCLFVGLTLATIAIVANWYFSGPLEPWQLLSGGAGIGLVAALLWTWFARVPAIDAAIELDRRFNLRERVSSALALTPDELETEAGRALAEDAQRRVQNLDIDANFPLEMNRWSLLPLLPALAALLLVNLLPSWTEQPAQASGNSQQTVTAVQQTVDRLQQQLEQRRKEAKEQGLEELEKMFAELQRGTRETFENQQIKDRTEAVVKLNDLVQDFEKRRNELASAEKLREQLSRLKGANDGPADKLAQALKNGDLQKAIAELNALQQQLKNGDLDAEQREKLANQLNEMKQKLEQMVADHQQKQQALEDQIKQAQQAGNEQLAQQLQQQLDQLKQQNGQMQQLDQLAQQLGQCSECLGNGDTDQAMAGLQQMQQQLQDIQKQLEELELLEGAMDQLAECKGEMLGGNQPGDKMGQQQGGKNMAMGQGRGQGQGNGMGQGRGVGLRPEDKQGGEKFVDSNVPGKQQAGVGVVVGEAGGPNRVGDIREQIKAELTPSQIERSDPVNTQQYPRPYREHTQQYLDAVREGRLSQ